MKRWETKIFVNSITLIRIVGTFLIPIVCKHMMPSRIIIYITMLLITDCIDGILARKLNVCTTFGALADQAADKLLGIATLGLLAVHYPIMILPMIGETTICVINASGATRGSNTSSSFLGKFKTWIFGICTVIGFCTIYSNDIVVLIDQANRIGTKVIELLNYIITNKDFIMNTIASICTGADIMVAADYKMSIKKEVKDAKQEGIDAKNFRLKRGKDLIFALFDTDYYHKMKDKPLLSRLGEVKDNEKNKRK